MRVEDNQASFHCNEVGFTAKNVEAICKVGASTKENVSAGTRYIGKWTVEKFPFMILTFELCRREGYR